MLHQLAQRKLLLIMFGAFLVTGASCPDAISPQSARDALVVAEYSYQAALKQAEGLVDTGVLKGDSARKALDLLQNASLALATFRATVDQGSAGEVALSAFNTALAEAINQLSSQNTN